MAQKQSDTNLLGDAQGDPKQTAQSKAQTMTGRKKKVTVKKPTSGPKVVIKGSQHKGIDEALFAAQCAVTTIVKDGHNDHAGNDYVSADLMVATARKWLLDEGLLLMPINIAHEESCKLMLIKRDYRLIHIPTKEERTIPFELPAVSGTGWPWDTASLACQTSMQSYFMRDLLQIPRGDEEVSDREADKHGDIGGSDIELVTPGMVAQLKVNIDATAKPDETRRALLRYAHVTELEEIEFSVGEKLLQDAERNTGP